MMMSLSLVGWLAQDPPKPPQGPEFGGSSPIGLVLVLLLAIALVFLLRSMNKHLRKVPKSFDAADEPEERADKPDGAKNGGGKPNSTG